MITKVINNTKEEIDLIKAERPQFYEGEAVESVKKIVEGVRAGGDKALFGYTEQFDKVTLSAKNCEVTEEEIEEAYSKVTTEQLSALRRAILNVMSYQTKMFKNAQKGEFLNKRGYMIRPVDRAGIYVPGGTAAYPSSVLMCALPAVAAGVGEIVMVTPIGRGVNPLTLVAAHECGVDRIFKVGGAQAIAALAYGTESIPAVDVIAGPGNIYVTLAKKEVFGVCGIDMLAGPSEILIIADSAADPRFVAADMLSQAEHDTLAASYLVTDSAELKDKVLSELERQLSVLERVDIAKESLARNGRIIVTKSLLEAVEVSNELAPEHLEIMTQSPKTLLPFVRNAGAVFLGAYSPEPLGDYYAGPDHVLPTSGSAKFFSALSVDTFIKKISLVNYSKNKLDKIKDDILILSNAEGLTAHSNSIKVRFGGGEKK